MKQSNLIIFLLLFSFTSFGQQLKNLKDALRLKLNDKNYIDPHLSNYYTRAEDVMNDVDNYLSKTPPEIPHLMISHNSDQKALPEDKTPSEFNILKKYRDNLNKTFQGFSGSQFIYNKGNTLPIIFALYGDTALTLIISGVYIGKDYNIQALTSKQRSSNVITSYFLPKFKNFVRCFSENEVKYCGMACEFVSRDFSDKSYLSASVEFVSFIARKDLITKYVAGDLSEDELIGSADIYVCDRDMKGVIKKIKISLE